MKKITLGISGMSCSACSNGLEKYLNKQEGINFASVNLVMETATIEYDEAKIDKLKIESYIKDAGFMSTGIFTDIKEKKDDKNKVIEFTIHVILIILIMYISMGHMFKFPIPEFINMHIHPKIYSISLLILSLPFLFYGLDIIKSGIKNLIHKMPNMDTLITIGVISSFLYSIYSIAMVLFGKLEYLDKLYIDSYTMVILFIKLGRIIDKNGKGKTREAIKELVQVTPAYAIKKLDNGEKRVTIDEVNIGDILICKMGEKIAVDGVVIKGKSYVDETFLTGESKPVKKERFDKVLAGSINYNGYFEYKAEKIGKESTISSIVRLVTEATNTKAPIALLADRICSYFVPTVIILAVISLILNLIITKNLNSALNTFVTVLVVACPCSLGLATPLAITMSEGICAKRGILVKNSSTLENAHKVKTIVFDKTGTLTYGTLKISTIINESNLKDDEIIKMIAEMESKSTHPIGKAFVNYAKEHKIELEEVEDVKEFPGLGMKCKIDNREIIIGNGKILAKYDIENNYREKENMLARKGESLVYLAIDKKVVALIGVDDILRSEAQDLIKKLRSMGIESIILSGDNKETSNNLAKKVGIKKVYAGVTPKEKANIITNLKRGNNLVMMCGDGINDSPALVKSDISLSISSASDIAVNSSDVILINNNLMQICDLLNISKKTYKIIRENLFWAFIYNIIMIPIAMGLIPFIKINPMIASLCMMMSSLTVILNSCRLKK